MKAIFNEFPIYNSESYHGMRELFEWGSLSFPEDRMFLKPKSMQLSWYDRNNKRNYEFP